MFQINGLHICVLLFAYNLLVNNVWVFNYEYINILLSKIYQCNYMSVIIIINIVGFYLLLKKISFEVNIKLSYR
jgi:hypothetical protein